MNPEQTMAYYQQIVSWNAWQSWWQRNFATLQPLMPQFGGRYGGTQQSALVEAYKKLLKSGGGGGGGGGGTPPPGGGPMTTPRVLTPQEAWAAFLEQNKSNNPFYQQHLRKQYYDALAQYTLNQYSAGQPAASQEFYDWLDANKGMVQSGRYVPFTQEGMIRQALDYLQGLSTTSGTQTERDLAQYLADNPQLGFYMAMQGRQSLAPSFIRQGILGRYDDIYQRYMGQSALGQTGENDWLDWLKQGGYW